MTQIFDVHVRGYQQTLIHESARVMMEPISNALDTDATEILVRFSWARGIAEYSMEDNDPQGFACLEDAFTLFAPCQRKAEPMLRGRFGEGEKQFVALCFPGPVSISTTSGTVVFDRDGRTVRRGRSACRQSGSSVTARVRMSRAEAYAFAGRTRLLIVPAGVAFTLEIDGVNTVLPARPTLRVAEAVLPTVLADADGTLRATRRHTQVTLHPVGPGETPTLYELGVPVVSHPGEWHINIAQKIPLSRSRDAVTPAYLRDVYVAALDAAPDLLTRESATSDWVTGALAHAAPETVREIVHLVHGHDAVVMDPSCPEAAKRAIDLGRTVIHGGSYPSAVWQRIRDHSVVRPAGHYQELRGDIQGASDGEPPVPREKWQQDWIAVAEYTKALSVELMGHMPEVSIYRDRSAGKNWLGACSPDRNIMFNAAALPRVWWTNQEAIDELLVHEFAHFAVKDHLSDKFHAECCRIGARLRTCGTRLQDFVAVGAV